MHEKLSQAVKLYDKLLTDQLSHPTWRRTSPEQARTSTLPTGSTYAPNGFAQSHGPDGYSQWAPSSGSSQAPQSPTVQTSFQPTYAPPPPPLSSTSGPSYSHPLYSYNPSIADQQPQPHITSPNVLPVSSPLLQPIVSGVQATQSHQPVSILQAKPPVALADNLGVEGKGQELWGKSTLSPLPESHPQPVTQPTLTTPPHIPSTGLSVLDKSTLARAHTISSRPSITSPPPAQPQSPLLARSSTVSYAPTVHTRPQSYSRAPPVHTLQHPSHPPPPPPHLNPSLPAFPTAPTSTPQSFDLYSPSVPTAPPQERREEMLIEF